MTGAAGLARDAIAARGERLIEILAGDPDLTGPETVHDLRVASRRLREAIAAFRALLPRARRRRLAARAREMTRGLGATRNADVGVEALRGLPDGAWSPAARALADLLALSAARLREEEAVAVAAASRRRLRAALDGLLAALGGRRASKPPQSLARRVLARRVVRLFRRAAAWGDPEETAALHTTRIAAKRLRYALEAFEPLLGPGYAERHELVKEVQEALGGYHDAVVLVEEAAAAGASPAPALAAVRRESWRALEARLLAERRRHHERFLALLAGWDQETFAAHVMRGLEEPAAPGDEPAASRGEPPRDLAHPEPLPPSIARRLHGVAGPDRGAR